MWGSTEVTETLSPGKATLSLDSGSANKYPQKDPNLPAMLPVEGM